MCDGEVTNFCGSNDVPSKMLLDGLQFWSPLPSRPSPNVLALSAAMNACGQGQRPEPWEVLKVWKLPPFFLVIGSLVVLASHLFLVASKFTAIL